MTISGEQRNAVRAWVETGSVREAAFNLGLSAKTIEYHLQTLRRNLGIGPLIWLAIWAVKQGIAETPLIPQ